MPSQRKRIGFLPSEEVHEIIDKLCSANALSQSKVTGLLVEEALRSRGVMNNSFSSETIIDNDFFKDFFEKKSSLQDNKSSDFDSYTVDDKNFYENIKMMHEFIEFKYFKKVMKRNNTIFEQKCHTHYFIFNYVFDIEIKN